MTSAWITSNFPNSPNEDGTVLIATNFHVQGDFVSVPPSFMEAWQTSDPPTYAELCALPIASQGWQAIFDQWKTKGIVA